MHIAVLGAGYVGLVSAACFADFGHEVTCVDLDAERIQALRRGQLPIYEPGLDQLVASNVGAKRLTFTTEIEPAVRQADVVFVAVGTPSRRGDGHADLSYVRAAAHSIGGAVEEFTTVVLKSTVPVGTGDEVERIIREVNPAADVAVVSNPEFLREGAAIEDFKRPDRIVIGIEDERARAVMTEVYGPLFLNDAPTLFVSRRTAELTKYAANAFLAMKISFINEIADLSEVVGADVQDVAHGIGLDNRIGPKFLHAGPGFGGSCFPKDTVALAKMAENHGVPLRLVDTVIGVNEARKWGIARKVLAATGGSVRGKTIGILGLTFKPNTDDLRESPALAIIQSLQEQGASIRAFDPMGMAAAEGLLSNVTFAEDPYHAAAGAAALVLVTEWDAFRALDLDRLSAIMQKPVLIDLRNIYDGATLKTAGFTYRAVGRPREEC